MTTTTKSAPLSTTAAAAPHSEKITPCNSGRELSKSKVVFRFIGNTLDFRSAV